MNIKRYIDMAIRREIRRYADADKYFLIGNKNVPVPEELRGPFSWSGLQKAYKKYAQLCKEQGWSSPGRVEYHTVNKYGRSRDFM